MISKTTLLLQLWEEARTRFSNQLNVISAEDLSKKLATAENSIGFLMRHIADVELLFAKNVFGNMEIKITAKTVISKHDSGEWINLSEINELLQYSYSSLKEIIKNQTDANWEESVTTKEFGTKTKAEALGRIISHTAYHAGQIGLIKKYGS